MQDLPNGTVTFLFTDVEGSTRLLHEAGAERYAELLAEHRRVLRDAFRRHGGVEVDTQGDGVFAAFPTAPGALAAAGESQATLQVPVRMGIHSGTPLLTTEGYVGDDVHRASRIAAAAHGGQVLVSSAAAGLIGPDGLRDLGEHRLKDLSTPERLFQLGEDVFPPLRTLYRTNLPIPATPFVGRAVELAAVQGLLAREDVRLLTLSGAGGSGKTRLALQAAAAAADGYPDGVWWVPLAPLQETAEVAPAAIRALGGGGELAEVVGGRRLLLLLDNFEHVVSAAGEVAALLAACPRVDVLVTSRERLRLQGEVAYDVPVLGRTDARELFLARTSPAQRAGEGVELLDQLCERLDDLPLAIELAAARTSLLTPSQLLDRLGSGLDLLRGGRDSEVRQRTLRATITWSYDLLDAGERRLLAGLSVFRGGWTLAAAEHVCEADLDELQSLVEKSLVRRWESGRFGMLETIREFADEQLAAEDRDRLVRRLLEHLVEVLDFDGQDGDGTGEAQLELAQAERPNIDTALAWALERGEIAAGLALIARLELYWATNDPVGGRERIDRLLASGGEQLAPKAVATAVRIRGSTFDMTGETGRSRGEFERSAEIFRSIGEDEEADHLMHRIAGAALHEGDVDYAVSLAVEALERDRRYGRRRDEAMALNTLARAAFTQGDVEAGVRLGYESAAVAESIGFLWGMGVSLAEVGEQLLAGGDLDRAAAALEVALAVLAEVGDRVNVPIMLAALAALAARQERPEHAGRLWGAVQTAAEREPRSTTTAALAEYEPYVETVGGEVFDRAAQRGRALSIEQATELVTADDAA
ncbi:MAG TPA: adenylate/guanylate cyclase domain-containing protein [Gaiellales bacterium]|nr:adenylate/guanylate cyclase domain-containing protein [Gaiellales bacterium]